MTLLPIAIMLCVPFACASLSSCNETIVSSFDVSEVSSTASCNTRTLWSIIWSCVATLFACTWTAIHPNIPGMDESRFIVMSRRLFIMVMALVAPELIITWAARQYFSARSTAEDFSGTFSTQPAQACDNCRIIGGERLSHGRSPSPSAPQAAGFKFEAWTSTHGFFIWMGGFMLYVDDKPRGALTPNELRHFVCNGSVDMPVIAEVDIEDRSKGDALSKGIAILQLAWFILHLLARYIQKLPITLLEIDTLAVASLTCIAYALWWKKPKDIRRPYPINWKATESVPRNLKYDKVNKVFIGGTLKCYTAYLLHPFLSLMATPFIISPGAVHSRRVPTLGGYANTPSETILLIGCTSGMVFGGIHCLGWNVLFEEQVMWRIGSLAILCAPLSISLSYGYVALQKRWKRLPDISNFLIIAMIVSSVVYIVARIGLMVLMILSLRSLPPGAFATVSWTEFFPHY